jgi:hypothetical protein
MSRPVLRHSSGSPPSTTISTPGQSNGQREFGRLIAGPRRPVPVDFRFACTTGSVIGELSGSANLGQLAILANWQSWPIGNLGQLAILAIWQSWPKDVQWTSALHDHGTTEANLGAIVPCYGSSAAPCYDRATCYGSPHVTTHVTGRNSRDMLRPVTWVP